MDKILEIRSAIYDHFHGTAECQDYFFDVAHEEEFVAYYNSMYLLQDSTESLSDHRQAGFSSNPLRAYIEFWGVMQAAIIQQDAISEIYELISKTVLDSRSLRAWQRVRALRNVCVGHPVKKDRPKDIPLTRSFMGRSFGSYQGIMYEQWQRGGKRTHPCVNLGALLDEYSTEAAAKLEDAFAVMKKRWPQKI